MRDRSMNGGDVRWITLTHRAFGNPPAEPDAESASSTVPPAGDWLRLAR